MIDKLEVIVPTYKSRDLTRNFVKSFEHFSPSSMEIVFHLVENSNDTSYKEESKTWAKNVLWHNNPEADTNKDSTSNKGSWANCSAIDFVKHDIKSEFVFVCHNDCYVASSLFFSEMCQKAEEGFELIGMNSSPARNDYIHSSGFLVRTELLQEVGVTPDFTRDIDVCEILTVHCQQEDIKHFSFDSTFANRDLSEFCNEPWKSLGPSCGIDRTLNSDKNTVIYAHLGRGSEKNFGKYWKQGKVLYADWNAICEGLLSEQE